MQISFNGIEALKEHEGFRKVSYRDTGDVWTIGYGSTHIHGRLVQQGDTVSIAEATVQLLSDLAWAQTAVNQLVKVQLKQNQFDALVSFVYNVGEEAFMKSTLLRKLNAKDYAGAGGEFPRWNKDNGRIIPGLVARREVERSLFEA